MINQLVQNLVDPNPSCLFSITLPNGRRTSRKALPYSRLEQGNFILSYRNMNSVKWTVKICAFIAHKWKQKEPRASQIDSFQSEQYTACTYALQCRAFK